MLIVGKNYVGYVHIVLCVRVCMYLLRLLYVMCVYEFCLRVT